MTADYSISTTTVKHHKDFRPKPRIFELLLVQQQGRNKGRMSCRRRVLGEEHEEAEEDKDDEDEEEEEE